MWRRDRDPRVYLNKMGGHVGYLVAAAGGDEARRARTRGPPPGMLYDLGGEPCEP